MALLSVKLSYFMRFRSLCCKCPAPTSGRVASSISVREGSSIAADKSLVPTYTWPSASGSPVQEGHCNRGRLCELHVDSAVKFHEITLAISNNAVWSVKTNPKCKTDYPRNLCTEPADGLAPMCVVRTSADDKIKGPISWTTFPW